MNTILGYDSSSDEDDTPTVVETKGPVIPPSFTSSSIVRRGNLGAGIKNTFNDSSRVPQNDIELITTAKITDFVPTSLRNKKPKTKSTTTGVPKLDLNVGNVFNADDSKVLKKLNISKLPTVQMDFKQLEDTAQSSDHETVPMDVEEESSRRKRTIDESKIIDFNLNEFYAKNNELQSTGELNFEDHERQNKKIKYHNTSGTNQLSELMRFSAKNTGKLDMIHDKAKSIKSQTAQRYGFKK